MVAVDGQESSSELADHVLDGTHVEALCAQALLVCLDQRCALRRLGAVGGGALVADPLQQCTTQR